MNPITNVLIYGIAMFLFFVAGLPWVAITILGLRFAWWVFYEVVTTRELKRRNVEAVSQIRPSHQPRVEVPTSSNAPLESNETGANPGNVATSPSEVDSEQAVIVYCTECGTARMGAGRFCVGCGNSW